MKRPIFLPPAEIEGEEASHFYDARVPGLGSAFSSAVEAAVAEICEHPGRWPVIYGNVRRRTLARFPYGVLYREEDNQVIIVAVMHLHRDPKYWIDRI